ncbi:NCS1 nucleoside transporter [Mycena capillaripes]|nr:NCS1 nucleoside transporter [Mycena capillaripes]
MGIFQRRAGVFKPHEKETSDNRDIWLDNDDIRPLKLADRTWTSGTYFTFWFSAVATVGNWYGGSAAQALGLSMWESIAASLVGQILIAVVIVFNGRAGAKYHVGYPILNRAAFGVYGAWWPTFNRAVMAIVWNGVNMVQGGQCVYVMLHAIFPSIASIKDTMGPGSALTSAGMIGFVVFWVISCCFLVVPVPKMTPLVYAKLVVFVISALSMLAWTVHLAGGGLGAIARQGATVSGSEKSWLLFRFIMLGASSSATFASNASDYQRYAQKSRDVIPGNLLGFPLANFLVSVVGNVVCATSQPVLGELVWNPLTYLDQIQTTWYTPANRAGCFFIAAMFVYSAIFSTIFENSLPAGNDLAALFPKWISIRTGFFVCAVLSFAICPWYLLSSAAIFVTFLSSYQIFLSAITGVLLCNYYLIGRGYLKMSDLFTGDKDSVYHFYHGWNLRAYAAYVVGIAPNFAGFLGAMGVPMPLGITRFYYCAYWVGLFLSMGVYYVLCRIWPVPVQFAISEGWKEPKDYVRPEEEGTATEAGESLNDDVDGKLTSKGEASEDVKLRDI